MQSNRSLSIVFFCITFCINITALYLVIVRRNIQPIKSRSPLWLAISIIFGQIHVSTYFWREAKYIECHYFHTALPVIHVASYLCMVMRAWKLHFVYNINKKEVMATGNKTWFHEHKHYINDSFLLKVYFCCLIPPFLTGLFYYSFDTKQVGPTLFCPFVQLIPYMPYLSFAVLVWIIMGVFLFKLRGIEDGFNIGRELRITISVAFCFTLFLNIVPRIFPQVTNPGGYLLAAWVNPIPILISLTFAVYIPLYLSFTPSWRENFVRTNVQIIEDLDKLSYFLTNPDGIPVYLRFLHSEFSAELLYLWQDITDFLKLDDIREQNSKANDIREMYLAPDAVRFPDSLGSPAPSEVTVSSLQKLKQDVEAALQNSFRRFKISQAYKNHLISVVIHNSLSEIGLMEMQQFNIDDSPKE